MKIITLTLALVLALVIPVVAQTLTPTCTVDANNTTKTCVSAIDYDGTSSYSVTGSAVNPATGDAAQVSATVVPLCSPLEVTRPSGKLQLKWVCNKDLNVTFTLTKQ